MNLTPLGVPKSQGEIVIITDASDVGGGSSMYQWQTLMPSQIPAPFYTFGTKGDGSLKHTYPPNFHLVPLGHFNWKWNSTRAKYHTYEKELLAGVLTIAT